MAGRARQEGEHPVKRVGNITLTKWDGANMYGYVFFLDSNAASQVLMFQVDTQSLLYRDTWVSTDFQGINDEDLLFCGASEPDAVHGEGYYLCVLDTALSKWEVVSGSLYLTEARSKEVADEVASYVEDVLDEAKAASNKAFTDTLTARATTTVFELP